MKSFTLLLSLLATFGVAADSNNPEERFPAWVIELPSSVSSVLVADTSNATMHRFVRYAEPGGSRLRWQDERSMSIGQNGAGKQRAWDKKTPLGTYFITERLDTSKLHDKYGAAAFALDYPNAWDRHEQRTGDGIWLHGVDKNQPERPARDTDGCLALKNDALLAIADQLEILQTPVIVTENMAWASAESIEDTRLQLRMAIDQWLQSQSEGNLLSYMSLYSEDFQHSGMSKAEWSAFRMQVFESRSLSRAQIRDLMLFADPAESNLYMSRFTQELESEEGLTVTTKRLYWRRLPNNRWQIVSEGSG